MSDKHFCFLVLTADENPVFEKVKLKKRPAPPPPNPFGEEEDIHESSAQIPSQKAKNPFEDPPPMTTGTSEALNPFGDSNEEDNKAGGKSIDDSVLDSTSLKPRTEKNPKESRFATLPAKISGSEGKSPKNKLNLSLKSSQSAVERPIYEGTPPATPEDEKMKKQIRPITPPNVFSTDDSSSSANT